MGYILPQSWHHVSSCQYDVAVMPYEVAVIMMPYDVAVMPICLPCIRTKIDIADDVSPEGRPQILMQ